MLKKCTEADYDSVIKYIQNDYPKCLYLFMNLKKYGLSSEVVDVYLQLIDGNITAVFLVYYSCLHVFSKINNLAVAELVELLREKRFSMIYCLKSTAAIIWDALPKACDAFFTSGWVAQIKELDQEGSGKATIAQKEDFAQIAKMIIEDEEIGKSYVYNQLTNQLIERATEGYSRNLVIKNGEIVVAHACTNAEINGIAVVAELIVNSNFRRKGYGSDIWRCLCAQLLQEGKEVYSFYYSLESRALHHKIGFEEVCEWGKIVFQYN